MLRTKGVEIQRQGCLARAKVDNLHRSIFTSTNGEKIIVFHKDVDDMESLGVLVRENFPSCERCISHYQVLCTPYSVGFIPKFVHVYVHILCLITDFV